MQSSLRNVPGEQGLPTGRCSADAAQDAQKTVGAPNEPVEKVNKQLKTNSCYDTNSH
jgi:hypothetical protein